MTLTRPFQRQFSINVWANIIGSQLTGPYFLLNQLNSQYYLEFLNNNMRDFESVPLSQHQKSHFKQDDCPAHSANIIIHFLDKKFPKQWLGIRGSIRAPRSVDLTSLDFFSMGYNKTT